jgi:hypothetical protein
VIAMPSIHPFVCMLFAKAVFFRAWGDGLALLNQSVWLLQSPELG